MNDTVEKKFCVPHFVLPEGLHWTNVMFFLVELYMCTKRGGDIKTKNICYIYTLTGNDEDVGTLFLEDL